MRLHHPERFQPAERDASLPLELGNGHAYIRGELNIDGELKPARFVLDTGAFHAVSLGDVARPAKKLEGVMLGRGLNGKIHGEIARIEELRLGSHSLKGLIATYPEEKLVPVITSGSDGNIGSEVLRRFTATFDYSQKRLLLRPNAGFKDPFTFSTSGLRLSSRHAEEEGYLSIDDVFPGSPAEKAGITTDDRLTMIEGRSVADFEFADVLDFLEGAPGTEVSLRFAKEGKSRDVRLVLADLL